MDRRDVLKLGLAASVGGSGCASLLSNPGAIGAGQLQPFLSSLDTALSDISAGSLFDGFLPETRSEELAARAKSGEALAKKTLRSLLLVGTLQELPPEQVAHRDVQARLRGSMGEFDDAMFGMTALLEGLSPTERAQLSKALKDDPSLGMKVMGGVDEEAARFGVSLEQRTKLRSVSAHVCARLRQSPELAITEYAGKMRKIEARHGARSALERTVTASLGSALIWQQAESGEGSSTGGAGPLPPASANGATTQKLPPRTRASTPVLTGGGIALGVGAVAAGLGFLGIGIGSTGLAAIGLTVGAIVGVLGLITLIVGLIMLATGS